MSSSSPYSREDIQRRILANFESLLIPGESYPEDAILNNARIMADSITQTISYAYENLGEDLNPYTAKGVALDRAGQKVGINTRYPSTKAYAELSIIRDTGFPAKILPAGTEFTLSGKIFKSVVDLAIDEDVLRVDSEVEGLLGIFATEASLVSPVVGFNTINTVLFFVDGRNSENDESYRIRVLEGFYQPNFGNAAFYNTILKKQFPNLEAAQVVSENSSLKAYPIFSKTTYPPYGVPDAPMLEAINDYLDSQKTFGIANTFTIAPEYSAEDITITALVPNTVETQKAVTTAIENYFNSIRKPGVAYVGSQLMQMILPLVSSIDDLIPSEVKTPPRNGTFYVLGAITFKEVQGG